MSSGWDKYDPAPIEVFHGEALEEFHSGAQFPSNEIVYEGIRFINGIEFNRLLARFKTKIMNEYKISSSPILKKDERLDQKDEAIKILKEALRWYADGMHWNDNYANEGSCAKMALAAVEKLEKE